MTILIGWYGLQIALGKYTKRSLVYIVLIGIFCWLWGISWIYEEPESMVAPIIFTIYVFTATLLLALCLFASVKLFMKPFSPSPWAIKIAAGIFLFLYALVIVSGQIKALILIPLMAIIYFSLRQNKKSETSGNILETLASAVPIRRYLILFLIPATSSVLYYFYFISGLKLPTNWLVYIITTPVGFFLFIWPIWMIWRKNSKLV